MVLVDSSVWIEFFKGNPATLPLNRLLDLNAVCINDLILAELIPSIVHKEEMRLKELLLSITNIPLNIHWESIIQMQVQNLKYGINKVGIPDIIIVQNAIEQDIELYALDHHFILMSEWCDLRLFQI
jgi:hypothetical protein